MAQNFIFCSVLWIVVAVIAEHTAVAENNTTTVTPDMTTAPASNTTAASSTTAAPDNTSASNTTTASNTTAALSTTAAPSNTTATGNSTVPGTTSAPTPAPGTTAALTAAPDPCNNSPCGIGSTCEARVDQTFICLCLSGDYYSNVTNRCETGKIFPGLLQLPQIVYENSMSDKISSVFKRTADNITEELDKSLKPLNSNYIGSVVLELIPVNNPGLRVSQHVNASVELIYLPESTLTTSEVQEMVKNATECTNCPLAGATFAEGDLCERNPCDEVTARCSSKDGIFRCTCQADYVPSDYTIRICLACPSGTKAVDSLCVPCPFGYSGFNCTDTWKLILVIVGSVLGGLLLIALILLIIVSVRSPKKSSKRQTPDIGSPYMSHSPAKGPLGNGSSFHGQAASVNGSANSLAAFANAGVPRFPQATANNNYDNRTNLEVIHGNSRQNLVPMNSQRDDDQNDINPHAQSRGQNNPYARSQGRTNPYYS